jgi:hypothetical protein
MDIQVLGDRQQDALSSVEAGGAEQFPCVCGRAYIHASTSSINE